jgi:class 3 adenylate cyclase
MASWRPSTGRLERSAARARCADGARALGLELRAGLHTGGSERRGDDLSGLAVHIGARVAGLALGGQVLVSGAVPPLVVGSGLEFEPHGGHELKGCPGPAGVRGEGIARPGGDRWTARSLRERRSTKGTP